MVKMLARRADESISIHRWFGKVIAVCCLGHVACHVNNYIQLVSSVLLESVTAHCRTR